MQRHWCFTWYPNENLEGDTPEPDCIDPSVWPNIRYCIWQLEQCPDTGRLHYQGYVQFGVPTRLSRLRKLEGVTNAHWEPRKGTPEQARDYCRKAESRIDGYWEYGTFVTQGQKFNYKELRDSIKAGASYRTIFENNPEGFFKYYNTIGKAMALVAKPRSFKTKVFFYYGPTGCGKSRTAMDSLPGAHWKQPGTVWWDTYDGTSDVVLDEYGRWTLPYGDLLRLLDRYPLTVQNKGGYVNFAPEKIAITTTRLPWTWYKPEVKFDWEEFSRRVDIFLAWSESDNDFQELSGSEFFNLYYLQDFNQTSINGS